MNQNGVVIYCISCGAPVIGTLMDVQPCGACGTRLFSTTRRVREWVLSYNDKLMLKSLRITAE
jgi:predicted RNA-binding Zn-ribbon protein involved in translation (DUF1610 family)